MKNEMAEKEHENRPLKPMPALRRSLVKKNKGNANGKDSEDIVDKIVPSTGISHPESNSIITVISKGNVAKLSSKFEGTDDEDTTARIRSTRDPRKQCDDEQNLRDHSLQSSSYIHDDEIHYLSKSSEQSMFLLSESNTSLHNTDEDDEGTLCIDFSKGCDVCNEPIENKSDAVFCSDCRQVICSACLDRHNKCNSTKYHTIISKDAMLDLDKGASSFEFTSDEYKSLSQTNDKDLVQFCELCDDFSQNHYINEAYVLCEQCDKRMCNQCLCRHHLDKHKKEHSITPLKERADKFLRKLSCTSHPDSCIIFFCLRHREIICILCKVDGRHDECEDDITNIDCIYEAASGIQINTAVAEQKIKEMACLSDELSRIEITVLNHLQILCQNKRVISKRIPNLKKKARTIVESAHGRARDKIVNTLREDSQLIKKKEELNQQILSLFEDQLDKFMALIERDSKEEIFIMRTTIESNILKYETLLEELKEPFIKSFSLTDQPHADILLKEINGIKHDSIRETIITEKRILQDQQAVPIGEVHLSTLKASQVVEIEILPNHVLLLCDKTTNKLFMFCKDYTLLSTFKLSGQPSCMAVTNNKTVIVSIPNQRKLQFVEIENNSIFASGPTKKTKVPCLLMAQYFEDIIAIVDDALCKCFVKMDTSGIIASHIYADKDNDLKAILFMAVCPVNEIIYITEETQGCVGISIPDGVIVFKFKETSSPCYTGLAMYPTEWIFIAERYADKIVVINLIDGKYNDKAEDVKDLIAIEGLRPSCIAYNSFYSIMAVHTVERNIVQVFKLI